MVQRVEGIALAITAEGKMNKNTDNTVFVFVEPGWKGLVCHTGVVAYEFTAHGC